MSEKKDKKWIPMEKIGLETQGLPLEFREAIAFWPVNEVEKVYDNLSEAMTIIERLELVKDQFPIEKSS